MVIFGLIGVTMVSLFSTSISSSATANETRRAFYLSESGIRYAVSELRQSGFSEMNIINPLNTTSYKMPPSGGFDIRVFGAWFRSPSNQNVASGTITAELEKGKIPSGFNAKLGDVLPRALRGCLQPGPALGHAEAKCQRICQGRGLFCSKRHDTSISSWVTSLPSGETSASAWRSSRLLTKPSRRRGCRCIPGFETESCRHFP